MSTMHVEGLVCDSQALAGAHDIEVRNSLAFVAGKGTAVRHEPPRRPGIFAVVDLQSPVSPTLIGSITFQDDDGEPIQAETVLPAGEVCYVGGERFWAIAVHDPARPRVLTELNDARIPSINGMVRRGNAILAACKKNHITVFDVTDPAAPYIVDAHRPEKAAFRSPHDIAMVDGQRIVVVNIKPEPEQQQLHVYRVAEADDAPLWPCDQWRLECALHDTRLIGANRVRTRGEIAFVSCNKGDAVASIDLREPGRARVISYIDTGPDGGPSGMTVAGRALFAAPGRGRGALLVYRIGEDGELTALDRPMLAGTSPDHDLVHHDGRLYSTDQDEDKVAVIALDDKSLRHLSTSAV